MTIVQIRNLVQQECQGSANIFGEPFFEQHIQVVATSALALTRSLDADPEIVELAAYLHDIAAIRDGSALPNHAQLGAEQAARILRDSGYPARVIEGVHRCTLTHSQPIAIGAATPEEVAISNADAVAQLMRPIYWFYYAFDVRRFGFTKGRQWLADLYDAKWDSIVEPARELVGDRYSQARAVLDMIA